MKALYLALGRDLRNRDAGTTHTFSLARALGKLGVDLTLAAGAGAGEDISEVLSAGPSERRSGGGRAEVSEAGRARSTGQRSGSARGSGRGGARQEHGTTADAAGRETRPPPEGGKRAPFTLVEAGIKSPWRSFPSRKSRERLVELAGQCDLIHERAEESGAAGARLAALAGKPLVLEINTPLSGHPNPLIRRGADWNLRRQARAATAVVTQTPLARHIIESYTRAPVHVVPNGADPELFHPDVEPAGLPAGGRAVVAFAGSLRPWHGVEELIEAAAEVGRHRPGVFLLVVGGGNELGRLRGVAERRLGAGSFLFTGAVAPGEVPACLAAADVLAAPFAPHRDRVRRKQFAKWGMWWSPVKVFEYMAMGKPIVASAAGCVGEYLAGAGLTVEPGETAALSGAVLRLLDDGELAARLGRKARERLLSQFTWRHAAERTLSIWTRALEARTRPPHPAGRV